MASWSTKTLLWLILCVNLDGPWGDPEIGQTGLVILGVSMGVFWMISAFKKVDSAKQIALLKVGGPHPIS